MRRGLKQRASKERVRGCQNEALRRGGRGATARAPAGVGEGEGPVSSAQGHVPCGVPPHKSKKRLLLLLLLFRRRRRLVL